MASGLMGWTIMGRAMVPDISRLPTRIQDIPKEVLRMYGIIIDDEDEPSSEEDDINAEPGRLVIDEGFIEPIIKVDVNNKRLAKECAEIKHAIQQFQVTTSKEAQHVRNVNYCFICKKVSSDMEHHSKMHCFFEGCPELIVNEFERERHKKMHDHPTKPLQCRWCKKRYRYYSYVERHYPYCKAKRKNLTAKENCKKESSRLK